MHITQIFYWTSISYFKFVETEYTEYLQSIEKEEKTHTNQKDKQKNLTHSFQLCEKYCKTQRLINK